ncbi:MULTISPECIES: GNAT family N-acetyltransferase [Nostocales]|uniref:GCN5 family acetyltransferase n=3 Tax=Nostocales TaxID=1161 RepID=A0A0C1R0N8_9CYAN|nr:GNAT family N-acetyltransferase [Tolypothrix bouteillei]KAF3887219.1 GNAT family N-acetyltransferase [Tolypothrix bouteillei VB521301]
MNEEKLLIRQATKDDISIVMELILLKAEFDGCLAALEATPQKLEDTIFCQNPLAFVLLAEIDENAIGFASYHRIYSTFLAKPGIWLDDLYIKAEYRHCGVGTALINHLCRIAQHIGGARIDWIVKVNNVPAVKFYEKMGAKIIQQVRLCRLEREVIRDKG